MLKTIPSLIGGELLKILDEMGHGDELVIADRNFPAVSTAAHTVSGKFVRLDGVGTLAAAKAIFTLFPLDSFVDAPIRKMASGDGLEVVLDVHADMQAAADEAEGRPITIEPVERFAFYDAAREAYAVVQTTEDRPYGCFLLKKGVIFA